MPPDTSGWSQPAPTQPMFNNVEEQIKKEGKLISIIDIIIDLNIMIDFNHSLSKHFYYW